MPTSVTCAKYLHKICGMGVIKADEHMTIQQVVEKLPSIVHLSEYHSMFSKKQVHPEAYGIHSNAE